jgi:DNA-binding SARP family transcriptional activator
VQFRILGPLEVVDPVGRVIAIRPRERVVLAMLLLEAGRVVSIDRLVHAVWAETPPPTARQQLPNSVSRLRRTLSDHGFRGRILARSPGYLLHLTEHHRIDLQTFGALAAAGRNEVAEDRPVSAAAYFQQALTLWRGQPLANTNSRLVEAAGVRLTERWWQVFEDYADVRLRLGVDHELIGELRELISTEPTREGVHARLIRALAQAGRPGEALTAYRTARNTFIEMLGIEPSEGLRRLESAVLHGRIGPDPTTWLPAAVRLSSRHEGYGLLSCIHDAAIWRGSGCTDNEPISDACHARVLSPDIQFGRVTVTREEPAS